MSVNQRWVGMELVKRGGGIIERDFGIVGVRLGCYSASSGGRGWRGLENQT